MHFVLWRFYFVVAETVGETACGHTVLTSIFSVWWIHENKEAKK